MKEYVVDASVCLTMLFGKNDTQVVKIKSYFKDEEGFLVALEWLKLEVANVVTRQLQNRSEIQEVMAKFLALPIQYVSIMDIMLTTAVEISNSVKDTVYDAYYHAFALSTGATYLTCDEKYYYRARQAGNIELVGAD